MRILYVINTGLVGGLQRHVLTLMRAFAGVAETAVVINTILDDKVVSLFEDAGIKVYRLNGTSGHDWRIIGRFRQVLADFRPDVIHAHGLPLLVTLALRFGFYGRLGRVPVVHSLHCPTGRPGWKTRLVANLLEHPVVKYWLPVSGPTWSDFRHSYPWAQGEVFFNPLLLSDFAPPPQIETSNFKLQTTPHQLPTANQPTTTYTIGMVGRAADQKDWPSFHKVESLVQEMASDLKVAFLNAGEESVCDGRAAIRQMDLFVMTSKHEQLPTTVLECFALGTPICGFLPAGGTSDILQFSTGPVRDAFIKERSCEKLAAIVLDLIAHPEKRQALVEDGRQILEGHFDAVKNCRGQLMGIYRRLND